jgi:tryptophanase
LPHVPKEEYIAQTLAIILYLEAGVRGVEVGTLLADRDPETNDNRYPKLEFLRLAIPRRTYSNNHMDVVAAGLKNIFAIRDEIRTGLLIRKEAAIMRHFTVLLEKVIS